jgi:hypothetical protein
MTPLAKAMEIVFIAAWCVGVGAWVYATRYWMPMWSVGFSKDKRPPGYMRKAVIGYGIFAGAIAVGFAAGAVAEVWGGGWGN